MTADSEDFPRKLSFRTLNEDGKPSVLTIKIDAITSDDDEITGWKLRAELDGEEIESVSPTNYAVDFSLDDLQEFILSTGGDVECQLEDNTLTFKSAFDDYPDNPSPIEITDYSGM